jgi:hypothetical protein
MLSDRLFDMNIVSAWVAQIEATGGPILALQFSGDRNAPRVSVGVHGVHVPYIQIEVAGAGLCPDGSTFIKYEMHANLVAALELVVPEVSGLPPVRLRSEFDLTG